jgi:hypothetical protein
MRSCVRRGRVAGSRQVAPSTDRACRDNGQVSDPFPPPAAPGDRQTARDTRGDRRLAWPCRPRRSRTSEPRRAVAATRRGAQVASGAVAAAGACRCGWATSARRQRAVLAGRARTDPHACRRRARSASRAPWRRWPCAPANAFASIKDRVATAATPRGAWARRARLRRLGRDRGVGTASWSKHCSRRSCRADMGEHIAIVQRAQAIAVTDHAMLVRALRDLVEARAELRSRWCGAFGSAPSCG